ncbi:uncharacterized protein BX664DRAFT_355910 [Halteromyces radiatus]|uniref:uncharacterized protein n=1 Tax=Halteromyces radiatus TaxID=101107 RepID=UPI00221F6402|nr:uncharacterized protein BX664DRAFT_355910 [Halteromyces radiatus]KAI8096561.1 hypothetical protein BX664DRAFT_355910 [Halteromyces radiatus]
MNDVLPSEVKHTSRFTEHFDIIFPPTSFEPFILTDSKEHGKIQQRSMSISAATRPSPFSPPVRMRSSPAITTVPIDISTTLDDNNDNKKIPALNPSTSHKHNIKQQQQQQQQVALLYKDYASSTTNRADIMIKRLSNWIVFLKLASGWLDEIVKMTGSSTFKKQKKENPELYDQINKKRKECQGIVSSFKKECREKIQALKSNPALQMEELLLRANETKKRMTHLSKLCEYADDQKHPPSPEMDPWLANLQVLRYLKRETNEENRLRELMVPIQQDMKEFESRLTNALETLIGFCVDLQTTVVQYGTTRDQVLAHFLPQHTWQAFMTAQQKDWVDEDHIKKNYLQINYPNKQHTHVATVQKGLLGRRTGVLKQYHTKYYVLTHYGYLHQFKLDDKVKPESSIYISSATIQPTINDDDDDSLLNGMTEEMGNNNDNNEKGSSGYIFEIQQKRKNYHFRTTTGAELVAWCRALTSVANGSSVEKLLERRKQKQAQLLWRKQQDNNSSITSASTSLHHQRQQQKEEQQQQLQQQQQQQLLSEQGYQQEHLEQKIRHDEQGDDDEADDDDDVSYFHSIHSNNSSISSLVNPALTESDIISMDIADTIVTSSNDNHLPGVTSFVSPASTAVNEESGLYFSSTSSPSSSSSTAPTATLSSGLQPTSLSPPPASKRAIHTYQANLNIPHQSIV